MTIYSPFETKKPEETKKYETLKLTNVLRDWNEDEQQKKRKKTEASVASSRK